MKLTDEEIRDCMDAADQSYCERDGSKELFIARAIESAVLEKVGKVDDEYRCGGPGCDGNCCVPVTKGEVEPEIVSIEGMPQGTWPEADDVEPAAWIEHGDGKHPADDKLNWQQCETTDTPLYPASALAALRAQLEQAQADAAKLRGALEQALSTLEGWSNHGQWVWPESALKTAKRNTVESIDAARAALEGKT